MTAKKNTANNRTRKTARPALDTNTARMKGKSDQVLGRDRIAGKKPLHDLPHSAQK